MSVKHKMHSHDGVSSLKVIKLNSWAICMHAWAMGRAGLNSIRGLDEDAPQRVGDLAASSMLHKLRRIEEATMAHTLDPHVVNFAVLVQPAYSPPAIGEPDGPHQWHLLHHHRGHV